MARTAAELQAIRDELDNDPLTRGYSGMADGQAKDDMNTEYRTVNRDTISGRELLDNMDETEYNALSDLKKSQWLSFTSAEVISATAAGVRILRDIFGTSTTTESNLVALRQVSVSRGVELGLGRIRTGDITQARALP